MQEIIDCIAFFIWGNLIPVCNQSLRAVGRGCGWPIRTLWGSKKCHKISKALLFRPARLDIT